MSMLRQMMQGDPSPLIQQAISSGAACTLPDGSTLTLEQLVEQSKGRTPQEAFKAYGYDFDDVTRIINS